jgi:hypothetical protein
LEYLKKTTDLQQVTDKHILVILYYLSSLIGGVSSIEENILVILYYLSSLIGGMSSIEENILEYVPFNRGHPSYKTTEIVKYY